MKQRVLKFLSNLFVFKYFSYQLSRLKATKNFFLTYSETQLEYEDKYPDYLEEVPRCMETEFSNAVQAYDDYATKFHKDQVVKLMKPRILKRFGYTKAQLKKFDREAFETILSEYFDTWVQEGSGDENYHR